MPDGTDGGVTFTLDGAHLRVDARPARLISMLRHGDGPPVVTAQPSSGEAKVEQLPEGARQATFQVRDDITVEATQAATFVAVADDSGRALVIAYTGELTVVPGGDDRFALGADEALVINGSGADPAVVPVAELSAEAHPDVAALLDATTDALFAPAGASMAAANPPSEAVAAPEERTVEVAPTNGDKPADGAAKKAAPQKNGGAKKAPAAAAGAGAGGGGRRKKGKKGRPQPQKAGAAKKAAAGTAAAAGAAGAAGATGVANKAPAKAAGGGGKRPPREPAKTGGGGGSGGGGGHDDDSYEDTPRDRRFLVGAVLVALILAVAAVLLLSQVGDDSTDVATGATTTTVEDDEVADTTTSSTTPATTTTTAPASTTTTARATTTTARATTTTAASQPKYSIEPKSCVQNGNTITYTASVKNDAAAAYDFTVDVSFKTSDGTEVAKGSATVSKLGSGRSADFTASGTSSRTLAGTGASCEVTRVDARPSA